MSSNSPASDPRRDDVPLEDRFVAYLDRELDEQSVREVEALLASDPRVQDAVARLEQTWEALDELERPELDRSFTETTLELVTVAAENEIEQQERRRPRERIRKWTLFGGGLLLIAAAGFLLASLLLTNSIM
jgi:anti-sigma factor RsiW